MEEKFTVPSEAASVERFVEEVTAGYRLDQYEREEWRDHLRHTPVDVEPYRTARGLVGLTNPENSHPGAFQQRREEATPG